jgi:CubicO group peptidase (beta-lactamase class C family)
VSAIYAALLSSLAGTLSAAGPAVDRWLGAELLAEAVRIHSDGEDRVLGRPSRFGLGFQLAQPGRPLGPNLEAFGHFGYGGSLGFADPVARVAFCFLTNRPGQRWQTTRAERLIDAVYESLA